MPPRDSSPSPPPLPPVPPSTYPISHCRLLRTSSVAPLVVSSLHGRRVNLHFLQFILSYTILTARSYRLARQQISLKAALRQFPDFPIKGIDFVDILPLFANHALHESLIRALELQVLSGFNNGKKPDVIVGLDARGFLFGPSLALRLGASFAPVRKRGKLPGPTVEAAFEKEYGQDYFQMQGDAVKPGQTVLVIDDIIATGKS